MKRLLAVSSLALALGACSSTPKPTTSPSTNTAATTTVAVTTTTPPTTAKPRNELGKVQVHDGEDGTYRTHGTVTVLNFTSNALIPAYRNDPDAAPRKGFRYAAIQVRVCLISTNVPEQTITVSWGPWNLTSNDGDTYAPADSYSTDTLISPLYPNDDKPTRVGQCRKCWIPFAVPNDWKPDAVEYTPEVGEPLTWQL